MDGVGVGREEVGVRALEELLVQVEPGHRRVAPEQLDPRRGLGLGHGEP